MTALDVCTGGGGYWASYEKSADKTLCGLPASESGPVGTKLTSVSRTQGSEVSAKGNRLVGLVVKASASRAEDPGFESRLRRDFFGVESYQ